MNFVNRNKQNRMCGSTSTPIHLGKTDHHYIPGPSAQTLRTGRDEGSVSRVGDVMENLMTYA